MTKLTLRDATSPAQSLSANPCWSWKQNTHISKLLAQCSTQSHSQHLILIDTAVVSLSAQIANYMSSHLHLLYYKIEKILASHQLPGIGRRGIKYFL